MKKIISVIVFTGTIIGSSLCLASTTDGWETNITVSSGNAVSRLSFGQRLDATDQRDGRYDVPSLLSGNLRVYFQGGGGNFWRDIRGLPQKSVTEWRLMLENRTGEPATISWDQADLPLNNSVILIETATGKTVDMKSSTAHIIEDEGNSELLIKVKRKLTGET